jgi:hypothetical protein
MGAVSEPFVLAWAFFGNAAIHRLPVSDSWKDLAALGGSPFGGRLSSPRGKRLKCPNCGQRLGDAAVSANSRRRDGGATKLRLCSGLHVKITLGFRSDEVAMGYERMQGERSTTTGS